MPRNNGHKLHARNRARGLFPLRKVKEQAACPCGVRARTCDRQEERPGQPGFPALPPVVPSGAAGAAGSIMGSGTSAGGVLRLLRRPGPQKHQGDQQGNQPSASRRGSRYRRRSLYRNPAALTERPRSAGRAAPRLISCRLASRRTRRDLPTPAGAFVLCRRPRRRGFVPV